jgi:hypothetical protein
MNQKQKIKDILKSENVTFNDIFKIEFDYKCTTAQFDDDLGLRMDTFYRTFPVSKEHFYLLINDQLTNHEERQLVYMQQQHIQDIIMDELLNIDLEWLDTNRQIKIDRVIHIHTKDTSKPTIRIEKGELDYLITDLDITNKKCRDMLLVIKSIKKDYPNNRILNISDERIDLLVLYANELRKVEFDNLHCEQDQIEKYLYKLTSALDNKERGDLLGKYARFRVWYITYIVKLRNSVKGSA